jgi:hypothetical protein
MNRSPQGGGLAGILGSLGSGIGRIVLGAVVVLVLLCGCGYFALNGLFNRGGDNGAASAAATLTAVAKAAATRSVATGSGPQILGLTTSTGVAAGNHPLNPTTTFAANTPVIYVVADTTNIRTGDRFSAVWTRDGQPYITSNPITANKDYPRTSIEFHIQPSSTLPVGKYTVQLVVNDKPAQQTSFTVR